MFRAPLHPSSGAYNCTRSLWFYRWSVAVGALLVLMMGGEAPETCCATHKRQVINLWNCCILLVDLFESFEPNKCIYSKFVRWIHPSINPSIRPEFRSFFLLSTMFTVYCFRLVGFPVGARNSCECRDMFCSAPSALQHVSVCSAGVLSQRM